MSSEKISIVCIIYKVEPFLRQCIESMINQTYEDLEIILCVGQGKNDDKSLDIAEEYAKKDSRIKLVVTAAKGTGDARNQGLAAVTGDYIGFVDGDDYAEPDMFETMLKTLKEHNADISVCGKYSEYEDKTVPDVQHGIREMTPAQSFDMILRGTGFFFHCWDKLFKAELFKGIKFPDDRYLEDRYVTGKVIGRAKKIVYDTVPLYHYRIRGDSLSRVPMMSEYNTDADTDFCEYVLERCLDLKDIAGAALMYDHITNVQNYLLYFKGTENDNDEMKERYKAHMDYIRKRSKEKNPEISGKVRLKIFLALHMQPVLKLFTLKNSIVS
ncbi:MAG: glycosyltransferase [Lachnospiraceae bacterium]|nr:glycosyltransferase [Lachnospiraceae bacterium]